MPKRHEVTIVNQSARKVTYADLCEDVKVTDVKLTDVVETETCVK